MFKANKRTFPAGTFAPTPLRVAAIIHLCIAFSAIFYDIGYPFLGKLFEDKHLHFLYERVFANEQQLQDLPYDQLMELKDEFLELKRSMQTPFIAKLDQSIAILFFALPPFQKAWLFFSIAIPLLLLLKIEGAHHAAWILPFICAIFFLNQVFLYQSDFSTHEGKLFPSEELIISQYLKQPLSSAISEQKKDLTRGWHLYLIDQWAHETPSSDPRVFEKQLSKAEFKFNIARISAIKNDRLIPPYLSKRSSFLSLLFLLWSFFFAWIANRNLK